MAKTIKRTQEITVSKTPAKDNRKEIFQKLKNILSQYSPPLTVVADVDSRYELVSMKEGEWAGRKFKQFYFAAAIIQSNYVGLHLMHVYSNPGNIAKLPEELLKCLKGKACFHIKSSDEKLMKQIEKTVKDGFNFYKKVKFV